MTRRKRESECAGSSCPSCAMWEERGPGMCGAAPLRADMAPPCRPLAGLSVRGVASPSGGGGNRGGFVPWPWPWPVGPRPPCVRMPGWQAARAAPGPATVAILAARGVSAPPSSPLLACGGRPASLRGTPGLLVFFCFLRERRIPVCAFLVKASVVKMAEKQDSESSVLVTR